MCLLSKWKGERESETSDNMETLIRWTLPRYEWRRAKRHFQCTRREENGSQCPANRQWTLTVVNQQSIRESLWPLSLLSRSRHKLHTRFRVFVFALASLSLTVACYYFCVGESKGTSKMQSQREYNEPSHRWCFKYHQPLLYQRNKNTNTDTSCVIFRLNSFSCESVRHTTDNAQQNRQEREQFYSTCDTDANE